MSTFPGCRPRFGLRRGAQLFHIDLDPTKDRLGYWHFPAQRAYQADSLIVLEQLLAISASVAPGRDARKAWIASVSAGSHSAPLNVGTRSAPRS